MWSDLLVSTYASEFPHTVRMRMVRRMPIAHKTELLVVICGWLVILRGELNYSITSQPNGPRGGTQGMTG